MSLVVLRSWSDGPPKVRGIAPSDTDEFVYVPDHRGQFVQEKVGKNSTTPTAATSLSTTDETKRGSLPTPDQPSSNDCRRKRIGSAEEIITAERKKTENSNYHRNNNKEEMSKKEDGEEEEEDQDNSSITPISDSSCGSQKRNRYGSTPNISLLHIHPSGNSNNNKSFNNNNNNSYHKWVQQQEEQGNYQTPSLHKPRPISDRILLRSSSTSPEQELLESPPPASPLSGRYRHLGPELAACIPKRQLKFGTNWLRDDPSNIGIKWSHRRSLSNSTPSLSHSQDFYSSEEEKMSSYSSQSSSKTPSPQPHQPSSSYVRRHFHFSSPNNQEQQENKTPEDSSNTIHRIVETPALEALDDTETVQGDSIEEEGASSIFPSSSSFNLNNNKEQIDGRNSSASYSSSPAASPNHPRGHRRPRQRQLLSSPTTPPPPPPDQHDYYRTALHPSTSLPLTDSTTSLLLTQEPITKSNNPAAQYLRALKSANLRPTNHHFPSPKSSHNFKPSSNLLLRSTNKSSLKLFNFKSPSPPCPKVSSEDDEEDSSTKSTTATIGGKTSKTDVILVHVIRKKLKVKSSGYEHSPCGSSDSGSDTPSELSNTSHLHNHHHHHHQNPSYSSSPNHSPSSSSSFVNKNNIKNQQDHHQLPQILSSSSSSSSTPKSAALISQIAASLQSNNNNSAEEPLTKKITTSDADKISPLASQLTSSEQIEQENVFHELREEKNLTPLLEQQSNNKNDRDILTSQEKPVDTLEEHEERREVEDSIPQNSSTKINSTVPRDSSVDSSVVAQVVGEGIKEKSESQKRVEEIGEIQAGVKENSKGDDGEDRKQDQTPVAPGCSAQFTSSTCSSLLTATPVPPVVEAPTVLVDNNKDTTTCTNNQVEPIEVPTNPYIPESCSLFRTGPSTEEPSLKSETNHEESSLCECEETIIREKNINHKFTSQRNQIDQAVKAEASSSETTTTQVLANDNSSQLPTTPTTTINREETHAVDQVLLTQVEQKEISALSSGTSEDTEEERMERGKNNQGPSAIASVKIPVQAVNKYVRSDSSDEYETEVNIWRNSAVRESFRGFCQELLESSSNASSADLNEGQNSLGSSHERIIIHVPLQQKQQQQQQQQLNKNIEPCQAINEGVIEFEDDDDEEDDEDVNEDDHCSSTGLSLNDRPETPSQRNNSIEYISVLDNVQVNTGAVHRSQSDLEYRKMNGNEEEEEEIKHQPKPTKWIISLDLGSRSSGFSYWYHGDPNVVHIGSWSGDNCFHKIPSWILTSFESHKNSLECNKTPTVNHGLTRVGQEALDTYTEKRGQSSCGTFVTQWREFLQMDSEAAKLLTFPYTLDTVDDEMDFVQLVTALVNFFGRAALGQIRSKFFNAFHKDEHLEWLITIPTSWNSHSRQCIREAAYKSGVVKATDGVNLIEDPMAAALFASMCGKYDNFLAVDVGGAFMHYSGFGRHYGNMTQTLEARSLAIPTPESTFETYLTQVVSREFMLYYKAKYRPGWMELLRNFEKAKCKFDGSLSIQSSAFIYLPYSFVHEFHGYTGMQVSECLEEQNTGIRWNNNGALSVSEEEMKVILKPTLDFIVQKIEYILTKNDFKNIVLTGGFAKCKFLKESLTTKFPSLNLIMPKEFPNGVLQGATLSLMPNIQPKLVIKSPFSIGVGVMTPFDAEIHPEEKKIVKDGKIWCADAWDTLIRYDQEMEINSVINKRSYVGAQPGQSCLVLPLFKSSSSSVPKLVTDKSVVKCCELRFESTKTWQEIDLILSCRASELVVMAVDRESVVHRVVIDFI